MMNETHQTHVLLYGLTPNASVYIPLVGYPLTVLSLTTLKHVRPRSSMHGALSYPSPVQPHPHPPFLIRLFDRPPVDVATS